MSQESLDPIISSCFSFIIVALIYGFLVTRTTLAGSSVCSGVISYLRTAILPIMVATCEAVSQENRGQALFLFLCVSGKLIFLSLPF